MTSIPEILRLLCANEFEKARRLVEETLRAAAAESPRKLGDVAADLVRWQGIFPNTAQAMTSEPYFRTVHELLTELAGPDLPVAIAAADNLGGLLGSIGKIDEAIAIREDVLSRLGKRPGNDQRMAVVRAGLSVMYQRAGREDKLKELFQDTGLCEHLQPAERYLRDQGGRVVSSGQPWSANCHIWVYFDVLLDCDRLIQGLGLPACIQVHDHRGTHDGSERGLVCTIHHDGIMGPHPMDAPATARTVTVP